MNNLSSHLSSKSKEGIILVVGNKISFKKYKDILEEYKSVTRCHDIADNEIVFSEEIVLVVVLGIDNSETHRIYSKCYEYKENDIPVVFGTNERALTYQAPNWQSMDLTILGMFHLANQYILGLDRKGAYVEFGVFDGRSFTTACHALKGVCTDFYAFDSFKGIVGANKNEENLYQDGAYYANLETFWHNMQVSGCSDFPIKAIQGPFQETLIQNTPSEIGIGHVSIVHIDSDVYEAAILALDFVAPVLLDGALILFDEFHAFGANNNKGERKAFNEWLHKNPHFSAEIYRNYGSVARSYIIHRA